MRVFEIPAMGKLLLTNAEAARNGLLDGDHPRHGRLLDPRGAARPPGPSRRPAAVFPAGGARRRGRPRAGARGLEIRLAPAWRRGGYWNRRRARGTRTPGTVIRHRGRVAPTGGGARRYRDTDGAATDRPGV
jgi:hypothetical protein